MYCFKAGATVDQNMSKSNISYRKLLLLSFDFISFFLYFPTFLICSPVENQPFNSKFNDAHKFILNEKSNKSNRFNMIFLCTYHP